VKYYKILFSRQYDLKLYFSVTQKKPKTKKGLKIREWSRSLLWEGRYFGSCSLKFYIKFESNNKPLLAKNNNSE